MAIYKLKWSDPGGNGNVKNPDCAGDVVRNRYIADLGATPLKGVTLAAGDIIDVGIIPAYTTVVNMILDSDDLDSNSTPTLAFDVGIMSGTPGDTVSARTCGNEFFAASTLGQAGGTATTSLKTAFRVDPVGYDRSIGIKITTAAATQATSGILAVNVDVA